MQLIRGLQAINYLLFQFETSSTKKKTFLHSFIVSCWGRMCNFHRDNSVSYFTVQMNKFLFELLVCSIFISFASGYSDDDAWNDYKVKANEYIKNYMKYFNRLSHIGDTWESLHEFPRRRMERQNAKRHFPHSTCRD